MPWQVVFAPEFELEYDALDAAVQDELMAQASLFESLGPRLGRPRVDTLSGAKHANLKELCFDAAGGVWRVAFALDPQRKAILLIAGDKSGGAERHFYKNLIAKAEKRFDRWLANLKAKP